MAFIAVFDGYEVANSGISAYRDFVLTPEPCGLVGLLLVAFALMGRKEQAA